MRDIAERPHRPVALSTAGRRNLWIGLLTLSSIAFSLSLACATPFAALATLAALNMARRDALILVGATWLANQAVGYGVLHYPLTLDSVAWGIAIGGAAWLSLLAARRIGDRARGGGPIVATGAGFLGAFVAYEGALYAASFVLGSGDQAFSAPIILWILEINALALAGLLVFHRVASVVGIVAKQSPGRSAPAG